jgi:MFS family permease
MKRRVRTPSPLRRDLCRIYAEGVAWSVMVGIGETYFPAFALALGMGEVGSGLIATVPLLAGGVLQLVTPYGVDRMRSRRAWAASCAYTQTLTFLPLLVAALFGSPPLIVYLAAGVYWGAGMGAGPAWNPWMDQLVPKRIRAHFFSRRSRATQVGVLGGLFLGGLILDAAKHFGHPLLGFAMLFVIGAGARLASGRLLAAQSEPHPPLPGEAILTTRDLYRRVRRGAEGHLLGYLAFMTATVALASPYFTPYLLKHLHFSYTRYMLLIGSSFAAKVVALTYLAGVTRRLGALRVLRLSALGIVFIPFLWLCTQSFMGLFLLQIFAGFVWAGHEFSSFLLFFDTIRAKERTSLFTAFNLANAAATVGGSLVGGAVLGRLGPEASGYAGIFALSGVARLAAWVHLSRLRVGREPAVQLTSFRFTALRPAAEGFLRPVLSTVERLRPARSAPPKKGPPPTSPPP